MAAESSARDPDPTLVERLLDRQRDHWRRGERVPVEALLKGHPTLADDRERLLDLIWNEVDLRAARGETPRLEEYRRRFPALGDDLGKQFEVFAALPLASEDPHADVTLKAESTKEPPGAWEKDGYEILEKLGQGAMGVVYKAVQKGLKRVVALKMVLAGGAGDGNESARFRVEAEAAARLHHPNIVQIYEVGEHDGRPFLSLEYCPGGGLDKKLAGTPQPAAEAAALVETLARAVHAAHQARVVHRDLKPANVLLAADGAPKVADFGLAKRLDESSQTQAGMLIGTPSYMAPEQAGGKLPVGPAADVYALGAILYECLTGRPPFRAASAWDTLVQVRHDDPVPPRQLQSKTPRDLETVCLKCLQKDPQKRYTSADALAEDLRRYRAGEPIAARPAGRLERAWRWGRRNPKDAALVAAGLLAVALGVVAYLWVAGVRQAAEQDRRDREAAAEQDRRDRQARATIEAERNLTDATSLWAQAKTAAVGELLPWERALSAIRQVKDFIDENAVEEPTRLRVEQALTDITTAKQEAENQSAAAARDKRMKDELDKLAVNQLPLMTVRGTGVIMDWPSWHDGDYKKAFADYGIDLNRPDEAGARIRASAIEPQLLAALEAWIPLREDLQARRRVKDLADRLSEPDAFHRELREALVFRDRERLKRLAKQDLSALSSSSLLYLSLDYINAQAFEDAAALMRAAQQLYPSDYLINFELAYCLGRLNPPRHDDEIRFYTAAVALQPNNSMAHNSLANALWEQGRPYEAADQYRTANRLDPKNAYALANLGNVLLQQGKLDEAVAQYHATVLLDAKDAVTHHNLAVALWQLGKLDESAAEYRAAVQLNPRYDNAFYGLGWVLIQQGEFKEALDTFRKAPELLPPGDPQRGSWEIQAKRAEQMRLLAEQLDAIVQSRMKPADAREGVEYAELCLYKQYPAAAARLFQDAFTTAPGLAETNRFEAARAAARAGVGKGKDAASVTEDQRAGWRTQARDWLRADLPALAAKARSDKPDDRQAAATQLRLWQSHVDFASVRDEAELKKLPEDEQAAWRQFWADVATLVDQAEKR